jgi:hypothetical protein
MTASGACSICNGVATHYVQQLKVWRCSDHFIRNLSPEEKMKALIEHREGIEPRKKPKSNNSPFGKSYFNKKEN